MSDKLYMWLHEHWRKDNHAKYQHYFEPWVKNLTDSQIMWFEHQMDSEEKKSNWL